MFTFLNNKTITTMGEVTKQEFKLKIMDQHGVSIKIVGDYPYSSNWFSSNGDLIGFIKSDFTDAIFNKYPIIRAYYVV